MFTLLFFGGYFFGIRENYYLQNIRSRALGGKDKKTIKNVNHAKLLNTV